MFIDSWDCEPYKIKIDGIEYISSIHCCGGSSAENSNYWFPGWSQICGGEWGCETERTFTFFVKHSASTLQF